MPNLIEYADLLKGLPDDRISTLMQNPTGEVPPFLVAAEAQRRQSIRQQFSGGPQESVVDTLTKQLAKVPQNIQAPMQAPPQMPPPQMPPPQMPPQAGVAALPGGEGMRRGGMVQRYQDKGLVYTSGDGASPYTYTDPLAAPSPSGEVDLSPFTSFFTETIPEFAGYVGNKIPEVAGSVGESIANLGRRLPNSPIPSWPTREERITQEALDNSLSAAEASRDIQAQERYAEMLKRPPIPRDENAGKLDGSEENLTAPDRAELKKKMLEIYGYSEPSGVERAQKWFAMAAAFAEPGQSTAESIANAGLAFSEVAAREKQARRLAELELKKAEYQFDLAAAEDDRSTAAAAQRARAEYAADRQSGITTERNRLYERIEDVNKAVRDGILTTEEGNARILMLQNQIDELGTIQGGMEDFLSKYYQISAIPSVDTASRSVIPPKR
jgi:hypothetical protein